MRFSPRSRSKITLSVTRSGSYSGRLGGIEFSLYRLLDGVLLLIREGKRWRQIQAGMVWDALELIERRSRGTEFGTAAGQER